MLRLANITLRRGARILLKDASATVFPGHRVGLVGADGAAALVLVSILPIYVAQRFSNADERGGGLI